MVARAAACAYSRGFALVHATPESCWQTPPTDATDAVLEALSWFAWPTDYYLWAYPPTLHSCSRWAAATPDKHRERWPFPRWRSPRILSDSRRWHTINSEGRVQRREGAAGSHLLRSAWVGMDRQDAANEFSPTALISQSIQQALFDINSRINDDPKVMLALLVRSDFR